MRSEVSAYASFGGYFGLILISFFLVFRSILDGRNGTDLASGKPFLYIRTALGALLCIWYFIIKFFNSSYTSYARSRGLVRFGGWLENSAFFNQVWHIVCTGPASWWWTSFTCTWTVVFALIIWRESARRGIKYPWAYMLLGQSVALSVSTSLYLCAMTLHPRKRQGPTKIPITISLPLIICLYAIYVLPHSVGSERFPIALFSLHALVLFPLFVPFSAETSTGRPGALRFDLPANVFYAILAAGSSIIHLLAHSTYRKSGYASNKPVWTTLYRHIFSHPAQAAFSLDVVWTGIVLLIWAIASGSPTLIAAKAVALALAAGLVIASQVGVNWLLVSTLLPGIILLGVGGAGMILDRLRNRNAERRKVLLDSMGIEENAVIPGTATKPPSKTGRKTVVGFWHPYCDAGGGGERVLWSAIAYLQAKEADAVVLIYSGDYPSASKEEIIHRVHERFLIQLSSSTLHFVPLPSRHLISDDYWHHFTLLGQSWGSLVVAWEALVGKEGVWGDIFLDSMGHGFTYPFVRFLVGPEISIGAYTHYPTVSADMVKRVRERAFGVENAGASKSWIRTQVKLVYYRLLTSLYAVSLLFAQHIMTNSSWTQGHIQCLLTSGKGTRLASLLLKDDSAVTCDVVYPPCDTAALVKLGNLENRQREVISLAQFRPEKEHHKQIRALDRLFRQHPEYRSGPSSVRLTMMGGARHPADQRRVEDLRKLATELGVQDSVEIIVNAPYPEIVRRLGQASIGLHTMQDEHFGINVVEFMAAGLIPVVHASAGPVMDIVVPHKGEETGFHATSPEEFAEAIHTALTLPPKRQLAIRKAARTAAVERFSLEEFEKGFAGTWGALAGKPGERGSQGKMGKRK